MVFQYSKVDMTAREQFTEHQETLKTILIAKAGKNTRYKHQKADTGFIQYTAGQILDLSVDCGDLAECEITYYKIGLQHFDSSKSWSTNLSRWKKTNNV